MSTFNELVEDLVNENLLDESTVLSAKIAELSPILELPESIELLKTTTPDLLDLAETHELKLPEFSFLTPENSPEAIEENRVKAILPNHSPRHTFHSTQNFLTYQKRRQKTKTQKKGSKFCRGCAVYMPFYFYNCRYCHGKLDASLFYYVMVMFSIVFFTLLMLLVLSSKTYN